MLYLRNQIAKKANIKIETLRYYENIGLIPAPERDANGYRKYDDNTLKLLEIIRYSKSCGLTLEEIKEIMPMLCDIQNIDYNMIVELINQKMNEIDENILRLHRTKNTLTKIKSSILNGVECPIKTTIEGISYLSPEKS
jgi:DNA-binding transcriptional MerR regulator